MVALIIISVGLLGIARCRPSPSPATGTARLRSLAAIEAASLASERCIPIVPTGPTGASKVTVTGYENIGWKPGGSYRVARGSGGKRPTPCSAVHMAAEDLQMLGQGSAGGTAE